MKRLLLSLLLILCCCHFSYAAAVQAMKQKKAQEQQMIQQQILQQGMAEQVVAHQIVADQIQAQGMADQVVAHQMVAHQIQAQGIPVQANIQIQRVPDEAIAQVADMSQILQSLQTSSRVWPLIADPEPKIFIVAQYIEFYKQQGVVIRNPPEFYAQEIDGMSYQTPGLLTRPFAEIMQFATIIEYDFDNGQDKDKMALQLLGEEGFRINKKRLTRP